MSNLIIGQPVGAHLFANVYNVPNKRLLEYLEHGLPLLDRIVRELRLTVVAQTGHQFSPVGYTYAYVLSESHFTIHTYPEYGSCYIDIFCCNEEFSPAHAIQMIQRAFETPTVQYQFIQR